MNPAKPEPKQPELPSLWTLKSWREAPEELREEVIEQGRMSRGRTFNAQKDTLSIEWAQWSWNPVTGCKHPCPYCYARDIATRFAQTAAFPVGFEPAFRPERLGTAYRQPPAQAEHDISYRNVFTCSMADLFGRWVPSEWIDAVLNVVGENPQWNFLFLTKFPKRYREFEFPENAWIGTTVDCQARVQAAEAAFADVDAAVKWLSIEPTIEPLHFERLELFDWLVMGGASSSNKTPEWRVPAEWWVPLHMAAIAKGLRVYHKDNLYDRPRDFPGIPAKELAAPDAFHYLGAKSKDDIESGESA